MANPNKMISDSTRMSKKLKGEIGKLMALYDELFKDIDRKFRTEYVNQNGSIDGLEDFYTLLMDLKINKSKLKNIFSLMSRMKDLTKYDINEAEKKIEDEKEKIEEIIDGSFR